MVRRFGAAPLFFFLAVLAALLLGYEQWLASVVLRERATAQAWPAFVPAAFARNLDAGEPLFASGALRMALAQRAVDDGAVALATRRVAALPPSLERDALVGRIDELRGDVAAAAGAYMAAGDIVGLRRRTQALVAQGRIADALALQRMLVARLTEDPSQVDALADTWLSVGRLEQDEAYAAGMTTPAGHSDALRAADSYARAVALAPLSERYLVAAGSQALNLGDLDAATGYFERARDADPSAADAYAGLGEAARRRGDRVEAQAELERAQRFGPQFDSVRRLAHELGS